MSKLFLARTALASGLLQLALVPSVFAQAVTFVCSTAPEATPSDTYLIELPSRPTKNGGTDAIVRYDRHAFFGSEETPSFQVVPGCEAAVYYVTRENEIYVECAGDGDAGYFLIENSTKKRRSGQANFPEGNIDYENDTTLALDCREF
jgi:hypothetical protein